MDGWYTDRFHTLHTNCSDLDLFESFAVLVRELGFDYCAYGVRWPLPLTRPRVAMFSNYPDVWQDQYRQQNYLAIDPTVQRCCRSSLPVVWTEELFRQNKPFWEDARSHGLRYGWAQSSGEPNGAVGMLSMVRSAEPLRESELRENCAKMTWLAHMAHARMSRYLMTELAFFDRPELSVREVEVLRWTGDGKTSGEIGEILNISERTVNFHINNAAAKLNAANKTSATIQAAMLGLLY